MCRSLLNLAWYKSSRRCPISNHRQALLNMNRMPRGAYIIYIYTFNGIDYLNNLGVAVLSVASACQGVPWLKCSPGWTWNGVSTRCPVDSHGKVTLRWTGEAGDIHKRSLSKGGTMCTTLVQCGITRAIFFNRFCATSKKCTEWLYHLLWSYSWYSHCHISCLALFNMPEHNRTYTTLVPFTVLLYYKVQHFPQTWWIQVEDIAKACLLNS